MAKICKPSSLLAAVAALALLASSSLVAAQEGSGIERVNLEDDVAGAVTVADDFLVGVTAPTDDARTTDDVAPQSESDAVSAPAEEVRSADELAQSANEAALPEDRSADDAATDDAATEELAVGNDADDAAASGSATTEAVTILGGPETILGGGWLDLIVDENAVSILVDALSAPKNYDPSIKTPVCVLQINSGLMKTVSGTLLNYKVLGCPINFADELGACRKRDCAQAAYEVKVYQQTWTNTLQVSSIDLVK